jgi:mycothiol synthase
MHHVEITSQLEGQHIEELEELIEAATAADGHEPIGEHKFLRLRQGDDLALAILAYESGRLVGYAHTLTFGSGDQRRISCEMVVHPDHRRQGIGSSLLREVIAHAEAEGARRLDLWAYNDSAASRRMAESLGLKPMRHLLHMHRHPGEPPSVEAPQGARIRPFRPDLDNVEWLQLNNRIFRGHPENGSWTLNDLRARMEQPWFRPEDFLLLEVDGRLCGFCWLKVEERQGKGQVGEIYVIGTAPEYQGRGLGRYLLSRALAHLQGRRVDTVAVYVDDSNSSAVALYESFDFHHHHVDVCYWLPLPASKFIQHSGAAKLARGAAGVSEPGAESP